MGIKQEFTSFMENAGVLTFGSFVTKSGRSTPYFINTGKYKTGAQIAALGDFYARLIYESGEKFDLLFGPAYKGIPLVVAASASLYRSYGIDVPYCFNRKEAKDHGEGGSIVGCMPKNGDRIAIVEDVVTAGTAVRESIALLSEIADVSVTALFVSVDRCEKGTGELSALDELKQSAGISVHPIVTVYDIISTMEPGDPRIAEMQSYLSRYGAAR